jgi:hypothetical protein
LLFLNIQILSSSLFLTYSSRKNTAQNTSNPIKEQGNIQNKLFQNYQQGKSGIFLTNSPLQVFGSKRVLE